MVGYVNFWMLLMAREWKTEIYPRWKRRCFTRAFGFSTIGLVPLVISIIFAPVHYYGFFITFLSVALFFFIAWGVIPYRHLLARESFPDTLEFKEEGLYYTPFGKPVQFFSFHTLENVRYVEDDMVYGLFLNDAFLPYFSRTSVDNLQRLLEERENHDSLPN